MLLPLLVGWEVLGERCWEWTVAALGLGPKANCSTTAWSTGPCFCPTWLQVFGQEHMCRARHVSAHAAWLFLSWKSLLVFFQLWPRVTSTQTASGTHLLGKQWLWNVLLLLKEMWQCRAWKAALMNCPALCWKPASLRTHLSQCQ